MEAATDSGERCGYGPVAEKACFIAACLNLHVATRTQETPYS